MALRHTLKAVLKRGALVAAANWPVAIVQSVADGLFKFLVAVPLAGGVVLVTLVIGTDNGSFATLDWRELLTALIGSLLSHRLVLAAFVLALGVVILGGSLFVFLVKAGTVGVLVRGERGASAIETPPLHLHEVATAGAFTPEVFIASAERYFPRYARLGFALIGVYAASGAAYVGIILALRSGQEQIWAGTLVTALFVAWTTIVNLLYLLVQIAIVADDCSVAAAARRVLAFLRGYARLVAGVFVVVLGMVVLATGAALLAFTALGFIFLIPFVWLAAVPLQLLAFLLRALVFQYIGLSAVGAYVKLYREFSAERGGARVLATEPIGISP